MALSIITIAMYFLVGAGMLGLVILITMPFVYLAMRLGAFLVVAVPGLEWAFDHGLFDWAARHK